ncbi:hypothetical protein MTR_1g019220 [Medicago truncatula]|uniref:Uncharacterized protein n=1 Tax=Medicago truncatula TaxID=3880 RepID=G7I2E8_MEDTR|nr:hypothetical protein MTR_1g019220 [Medicago truncatula]
MELPDFDPNTKLVAVYYNGGTPPHLFRIRDDVTLFELKEDRMKLKNDDVRTMFYVFVQHSTRGPIELDASLVRSAEQIRKSLHRARNYEEIRALLEGPEEEEVSLDDP